MSDIKIQPSATGSGTVTITAPTTNTARVITLPDGTGTLAFTTGDDDKLPLSGGTMTGVIAGFTSTGIDDNATSNAITIDASENVGIGTATPSFENGNGLNIHRSAGIGSHLKLTDSTTGVGGTNGMDIYAWGTSAYIENYESADMVFRNNGGEVLRFKGDGRGLSQFTAKAWCNFADNGSINDSHNVSSITNSNTGIYTINLTNNMANTNYVTLSGGGSYNEHLIFAGRSVGSFPCYGRNNLSDSTSVDVNGLLAVFGD